jgi:hypothetical protein
MIFFSPAVFGSQELTKVKNSTVEAKLSVRILC